MAWDFQERKYSTEHQDLLRAILGSFPEREVWFRYDPRAMATFFAQKQPEYSALLGSLTFSPSGRCYDLEDAIIYLVQGGELEYITSPENLHLFHRNRNTSELVHHHPHKNDLEKLSAEFQKQFRRYRGV